MNNSAHFHNVHYLSDIANNIELIFCQNSTISYPLHNHISVCAIGLLLSGTITLTLNGQTRQCRANDHFIIPPYAPHSLTAQTPYSLLTICVSSATPPEQTQNLLPRLLAELGLSPSSQQRHILASCLNSLSSITPPNLSNAYLTPARNQLELHPEAPLHIADMARAASTSKYHFIRSFRQSVGLTPHQFQIQNRIRKAQRLLPQTDNITEVAMITGFYDHSHFIRHFQKIVGLTPTTYKKSCQLLNPKQPH